MTSSSKLRLTVQNMQRYKHEMFFKVIIAFNKYNYNYLTHILFLLQNSKHNEKPTKC